MPGTWLLLMKYLVVAEPLLTAGALVVYCRTRPEKRIAAVRQYLIARLVCVLINAVVLACSLSFPESRIFWRWTYFLAWYGSSFVLTWFLYRAAGSLFQLFLRPFRGLQALAAILYRWLIIVVLLVLLPSSIALVQSLSAANPSDQAMPRFIEAYGIAQFVPVAFALFAAVRLGLRASDLRFGILAGLCLEPLYDIIAIWFLQKGIWGWYNLFRQVVTDATLLLWISYFLRAHVRELILPAGANLEEWDLLVRRALRHRLPPEDPALADDPHPPR